MDTTYSQSEPVTQPSPTAITTPAQRWASATLDSLIILSDQKPSSLTRLKKRAIEALFVPATGREVQHG
ncbi:MAG: hypothetical protein M3R24_20575 [Chloroflexota bacterium]|nr:hypothetical protein [Chloroflexota bacterium]